MSGVRSGVNGTPTFFVNGARHDGGYDYESLVEAIDNASAIKSEISPKIPKKSRARP
jgi:hypothetical protein